MSRRFEFMDLGEARIVTDDAFTDDGEPDFDAEGGQVALVIGNPYATAAVFTGTPDALIGELIDLLALLGKHRREGTHVWLPFGDADPEDGGACRRCGEDAASPQHQEDSL